MPQLDGPPNVTHEPESCPCKQYRFPKRILSDLCTGDLRGAALVSPRLERREGVGTCSGMVGDRRAFSTFLARGICHATASHVIVMALTSFLFGIISQPVRNSSLEERPGRASSVRIVSNHIPGAIRHCPFRHRWNPWGAPASTKQQGNRSFCHLTANLFEIIHTHAASQPNAKIESFKFGMINLAVNNKVSDCMNGPQLFLYS